MQRKRASCPRCGWHATNWRPTTTLLSFIVSDGVGVGIVVNGELFRGHENMAGEFGHIPLSMDGPRCLCGNLGCWEAYISNIATLS